MGTGQLTLPPCQVPVAYCRHSSGPLRCPRPEGGRGTSVQWRKIESSGGSVRLAAEQTARSAPTTLVRPGPAPARTLTAELLQSTPAAPALSFSPLSALEGGKFPPKWILPRSKMATFLSPVSLSSNQKNLLQVSPFLPCVMSTSGSMHGEEEEEEEEEFFNHCL